MLGLDTIHPDRSHPWIVDADGDDAATTRASRRVYQSTWLLPVLQETTRHPQSRAGNALVPWESMRGVVRLRVLDRDGFHGRAVALGACELRVCELAAAQSVEEWVPLAAAARGRRRRRRGLRQASFEVPETDGRAKQMTNCDVKRRLGVLEELLVVARENHGWISFAAHHDLARSRRRSAAVSLGERALNLFAGRTAQDGARRARARARGRVPVFPNRVTLALLITAEFASGLRERLRRHKPSSRGDGLEDDHAAQLLAPSRTDRERPGSPCGAGPSHAGPEPPVLRGTRGLRRRASGGVRDERAPPPLLLLARYFEDALKHPAAPSRRRSLAPPPARHRPMRRAAARARRASSRSRAPRRPTSRSPSSTPSSRRFFGPRRGRRSPRPPAEERRITQAAPPSPRRRARCGPAVLEMTIARELGKPRALAPRSARVYWVPRPSRARRIAARPAARPARGPPTSTVRSCARRRRAHRAEPDDHAARPVGRGESGARASLSPREPHPLAARAATRDPRSSSRMPAPRPHTASPTRGA